MLSNHGRFAPADSLLQFLRGAPTFGTANAALLIFGPAWLQRSRIAEGMADRERAVKEARTFLAVYDLAVPAAQPWVNEARDRVRRFSAMSDTATRSEAPARP